MRREKYAAHGEKPMRKTQISAENIFNVQIMLNTIKVLIPPYFYISHCGASHFAAHGSM
jgi:hypothetical protein